MSSQFFLQYDELSYQKMLLVHHQCYLEVMLFASEEFSHLFQYAQWKELQRLAQHN